MSSSHQCTHRYYLLICYFSSLMPITLNLPNDPWLQKENLFVQSQFGNTFEMAVKRVASWTPSSKRSWASSTAAVYVQIPNSINKWDIFNCEKFFQRRNPQHFYCSLHCGRHFSGFTVNIYIFTFYRKQPSIPSAKHSAASSHKTPCLMKCTICLSSAAFPLLWQLVAKEVLKVQQSHSEIYMSRLVVLSWPRV